MIGRIKTSWRIFAGGRPGLRFRERYRLRQSRGHRGLDPEESVLMNGKPISMRLGPGQGRMEA